MTLDHLAEAFRSLKCAPEAERAYRSMWKLVLRRAEERPEKAIHELASWPYIFPRGRFPAACADARAGCGEWDDEVAKEFLFGERLPYANLTEAECAGLRKQALDLLRADLDAWRGLLDKVPDQARPAVTKLMRLWLDAPDFSGVRGPDALAKLPEAERKQWQKLWGDVQQLLDRAADKPPQKDGEKKP